MLGRGRFLVLLRTVWISLELKTLALPARTKLPYGAILFIIQGLVLGARLESVKWWGNCSKRNESFVYYLPNCFLSLY